MSHSFNRVNYGANKVIGGIDFKLGACGMMRTVVFSIDDRISHAAIVGGH